MTTTIDFMQTLWNDPDELAKFEQSPKHYLISQGAEIPEDVEVHAHVDTPTKRSIVLPKDRTDLPDGDNPLLDILGNALENPDQKARLVNSPKTVLAEAGVSIPDDVTLTIYQNKASEIHVVVPANPAANEMSEGELEAVAGGVRPVDYLCNAGKNVVTSGCDFASGAVGDAATKVSSVGGGFYLGVSKFM